MKRHDGTEAGLQAAIAASDEFHAVASDPATSVFLLPLTGVHGNPFAMLSFTDLPDTTELLVKVGICFSDRVGICGDWP